MTDTASARATSRDENEINEQPNLDPLPIVGEVLCIFLCKDCHHQWTAVGGKRVDGTISIKLAGVPGDKDDPTVCAACGSRRNGLNVLDAGELPVAVIRLSPVEIARARAPKVPTLWDTLDNALDTSDEKGSTER